MHKKDENVKIENFSIKDIIIFNIINENKINGITIPKILEQIEEWYPDFIIQQSYVFSLFEKLVSAGYLYKNPIRPRYITYTFSEYGEMMYKKLLSLTGGIINMPSKNNNNEMNKVINSLKDNIDTLSKLIK